MSELHNFRTLLIALWLAGLAIIGSLTVRLVAAVLLPLLQVVPDISWCVSSLHKCSSQHPSISQQHPCWCCCFCHCHCCYPSTSACCCYPSTARCWWQGQFHCCCAAGQGCKDGSSGQRNQSGAQLMLGNASQTWHKARPHRPQLGAVQARKLLNLTYASCQRLVTNAPFSKSRH